MTKTEKKLNTRVNKEFAQALSALNPGDNLAIVRPPERRWTSWTSFVPAALVVLGLLAAGTWYFLIGRPDKLIDKLPAETSFYVSLALPSEPYWYDWLFFWERDTRPSAAASRLYQKLDLIGWDGVKFSEDILPLWREQIELARLENGTLVLKTTLTDSRAWLALTGAATTGSGEETKAEIMGVRAEERNLSGWWPLLTKNSNKIAWLVRGHDLYLSDSPDFVSALTSRRLLPKIEPALVRLFIKDNKALSGLDERLAQILAASAEFPFIAVAKTHGQDIVWRAGAGQNTIRQEKKKTETFFLPGTIGFFAHDLGGIYDKWRKVLLALPAPFSQTNIETMEKILAEFYGLDLGDWLKAIGERPVSLSVADTWFFIIHDQTEQASDEILNGLRGFGAALFAITHPSATEHKLNDGTTMVELLADPEGIQWRAEEAGAAEKTFKLEELRGQGEAGGFWLGFVPDIGYILSTGRDMFFSSLNQIQSQKSANPEVDRCWSGRLLSLGAIFPTKVITSDQFLNDIIKQIGLAATTDDLLVGCIQF